MDDPSEVTSGRVSWLGEFFKDAAPKVLLAILLVLWAVTSLTQIKVNEQGIRERFGVITGDVMEPGIHLGLPWPMDRVRIQPARKLQHMLVGFNVTDELTRSDLIWSAAHGIEEDRFVTSSGNEVISFDIEIYYRISDIYDYTYTYSDPQAVLRQIAYQTIYAVTRNTDTDRLLTINRSELSEDLRLQIQEGADDSGIGIEITTVAIIAIHPPFEIADAYQAVVSSLIEQEKNKILGQTYREQVIPEARASAQTMIDGASGYAFGQVSTATGEAYSFTTLAEAIEPDREVYMTRRWYEALTLALAGKRLYIVEREFLEGNGGNDYSPLWFELE